MSFPPETAIEARRHDFLASIAEKVAQHLIEKHGVAEEAAVDAGNDLADFLAASWKGQSIYMPVDQAFKLNERDWKIFRDFQRGNANELAREHGVSKVRIHQIYKRCLVEFRARTQHSLFPTVHISSAAGQEAAQERAADA